MKAKWPQLIDLISVIEEFDPDWSDHFFTVEQAATFYENEAEFIELVNEVLEEESDEDE